MYLHVGTVSLSSDLWTYWSLDSNWELFKLSQQTDAVLITAACVSLPQAVLPTDRCIPSSLSCEVSVIIFLHDLKIYWCHATFVHYLNA